jgi:hypothetical protein
MRAIFAIVCAVALSLPAFATDTLWIFDADFEDMTGDNAGWTTQDLSGQRHRVNYWHKDTIRITEEYLGDSTWWCGRYGTDCWVQPRGYGNDWVCKLEREFPLSEWSDAGDIVLLSWDQRYAIEGEYDYGYVDVSDDDGVTWTTLRYFSCSGFAGKPGPSKDWDSVPEGHQELNLSSLAGQDVRLRFRFESDGVYSSSDVPDNPPNHTVLDGAWQLDNITWSVDGDVMWLDDCESPGDNGWAHDDITASGQVGLTFRRSLEDVVTPPRWMMVAYDGLTDRTADGMLARLASPPIDMLGAPDYVLRFSAWLDLPTGANDIAKVRLRTSDEVECLDERIPVGWVRWHERESAPGFITVTTDTFFYEPDRWVGLEFSMANESPAGPGVEHGVGLMIDRVRVGVPIRTEVPEASAGTALAVHPNPFNPTATIEYSVPTAGRVTLTVYGLAGRLVATLVDDERERGRYETTWRGTSDDGVRVASGVYFVKLTTETSESTGRLVLLK